jgi:hypothetical protein
VRAVDLPVSVHYLEIFADRDLRSFKVPRQFRDQHAALAVQDVQNRASALFVQQSSFALRGTASATAVRLLFRISFYSVLFRLSTGKVKLLVRSILRE